MNRRPSLSSSVPKPLLPHDWEELAPLLDALLDAAPERRAALLAELSQGDAARRAQLELLIAECELDTPLLSRPAAERFPSLFADDDEKPLPPVLGGRYRIEREAGRGGMARVYLAHDDKYSRDVAVKVVRPDVAASLGSERFLREIAIAARLRHPNIVPLYDSGDADGLLYFVMPYEEGPSLRTRLERGGSLPVPECVSVLRDVARALAYAHERGVVHRDVKPENIMMSGGAAVVTDFGIAKALSAAQGDTQAGSVTNPGASLGTPEYMAPEQAVGDPSTDHRADIYSFGCLAYELFAGHPPFHDLPTHEIIAAHVATQPVPLSEVSAVVPESISRLVARCLEKRPMARPQSAQEVLADLEAVQTGPHAAARRRRRPSRILLAASVIAGLPLIGYLVSRGRTSAANASREATVAVLPLVSLGDSVQRDLAYGLSDEIATALVKMGGVRVMSRGGIATSREQRYVDPEKTGRELGAQFLVMGSLKSLNGRLTVMAQLVQARDGALVWADQFDRSLDDLAAVRDEIARAVGDSLRRKAGVPVDGRARAQPARAINPQAYRFYVLGQRALTLRGQSTKASVDRFTSATELDTLYAEAFSGLSLALALLPYFEPKSWREIAGQVTSAAQRALRLDSTLASPHVALGLLHQYAYAWDSAAAEFQTAVRLRGADDVEPLVQYGRHWIHRGRTDSALKYLLTARRTEPASALVSSWVAYAYFLQGQMESALTESAQAFQNDSTNYTALSTGVLIRLNAGDSHGARDLASRFVRRSRAEALYTFAALGDTATALGRLRELEHERPNGWLVATTRAYVMLGIGDTTEAMKALERARDAHELWPAYGSVLDPMYDPVRSSARFHALLRSVNLPLSPAILARWPKSR